MLESGIVPYIEVVDEEEIKEDVNDGPSKDKTLKSDAALE